MKTTARSKDGREFNVFCNSYYTIIEKPGQKFDVFNEQKMKSGEQMKVSIVGNKIILTADQAAELKISENELIAVDNINELKNKQQRQTRIAEKMGWEW